MSLDTLKQKEQPQVSIEIVTGDKAYERVRAFLGDFKDTYPNREPPAEFARAKFDEKEKVFIASSASKDVGILIGEDRGNIFHASYMLSKHSPDAYGVGEKLLNEANAKYEIVELIPLQFGSRNNISDDPVLRSRHQDALERYYEKLGFVEDPTRVVGAMTRKRKQESL